MSGDKTIFEDQKELGGWLIVLNGQWKGRDYRLFSGKTVVGSSPYANIYLPDNRVEPFHFSIRLKDKEAGKDTGKEVWITDLDSDSGLFIDQTQVFRKTIEDETLFKVSDMEFLIKLF